MCLLCPKPSLFNSVPDKDILVSVWWKKRRKSDSNSMLWGQPSFFTELVMSSCVPPSNYILGKPIQLNYTYHNIECKVKLGVRDFNFSTKYKLIIYCEAFGVECIDFSPKQFWYLFEEKKFNTNWKRWVYKKILFSLCLRDSTLLSYYSRWIFFQCTTWNS